jgi:hypothetical protein
VLSQQITEPLEGMAEATLALATAPPGTLRGEVRRSLELLAELDWPVRDLRGEHTLPGYSASELPDRIAELAGEATKPRDLRGAWGKSWGKS